MEVEGEVVYFYLYDVADEIDLTKVEKVLRRSPELVEILGTKAIPTYITIRPAPLFVSLGKKKVEVLGKEVEMQVATRIYSVGAISIILRIPFKEKVETLISYHSLKLKLKEKEVELEEFSKDTLKRIVENIKDVISPPHKPVTYPQKYVVFCIRSTKPKQEVEKLVGGKVLTAILREKENIDLIPESEVEDALKYKIFYQENEMVIIDWYGSMIFSPQPDYEDELLTLELANLQYLELRSYDSYLDEVIDRAYEDLEKLMPLRIRHMFSFRPSRVMRELMATRMEIGEIFETTINITKFIGDWYLAKVYACIADKLYLKEWERVVESKLDTLEELYGMLFSQTSERRMSLLEIIMIIILIVWMLAEFF